MNQPPLRPNSGQAALRRTTATMTPLVMSVAVKETSLPAISRGPKIGSSGTISRWKSGG